MTTGSRELREELQRLTDRPRDIRDREQCDKWLDEQIHKIGDLRAKYHHTIVLHEHLSDALEEANCFTYALGIKPDEIRDMCCGQTIFPGTQFVSSLVGSELKLKTVSEVSNGDIVLYFSDSQKPVHAGIWKNGRITSKWGSGLTHVWEHELHDVPISYGNTVQFFTPLSPKQAVDAFNEWASTQ